MSFSETEFEKISQNILDKIFEQAEEWDDADTDLVNGILTIELDEVGQFLLNKHAPLMQIWVSSPLSGAWHFAFDEANEYWKCTKTEIELFEFLSKEFSQALQEPTTLQR